MRLPADETEVLSRPGKYIKTWLWQPTKSIKRLKLYIGSKAVIQV